MEEVTLGEFKFLGSIAPSPCPLQISTLLVYTPGCSFTPIRGWGWGWGIGVRWKGGQCPEQ